MGAASKVTEQAWPCHGWFTGKEQLTAALSKMDVCYEINILLSAYTAAAVIRPCVRHAPTVIVTINLEESDYVKNRVNKSGCDTKQMPAPRHTLPASIICLLCHKGWLVPIAAVKG